MSIRSLFWPGFILGMLLMTGVSCLGVATVLGVSESTFTDLQAGAEPVWTPPPSPPTPDQAVAEQQRSTNPANQYTFQIGDSAQNITSGRVNIRQTSGYRNKEGSDVIAQAQPGDVFAVVEGPQETDSLLWWRVRYITASGATVEGWMAEATASGVTIMGR